MQNLSIFEIVTRHESQPLRNKCTIYNVDWIDSTKDWGVCCMNCLFAFKCQFIGSLHLSFTLNIRVLNKSTIYACIPNIFNWPLSIELKQQQQKVAKISNDMMIPKRTKGCKFYIHRTYLLCKLIAVHVASRINCHVHFIATVCQCILQWTSWIRGVHTNTLSGHFSQANTLVCDLVNKY